VGLLVALGRSGSTRSRTPSTSTSTTISSGRPTRSSTAVPGSRTRRPRPTRPLPTTTSRTSSPVRERGIQRAASCCPSRRCRRSSCCRSCGPGACRWTRRRSGSDRRRRGARGVVDARAGSGSRSGCAWVTTLVFATGTVWWWAAAVGKHLVPRPPRRGDRRARRRRGRAARRPAGAGRAPLARATRRPSPGGRSTAHRVLAGLLLGIAATARLPLVFGAPFLVLVGGGGSVARRTLSAAVGGVLPVAALLGYTWLTTGISAPPGLRLPVPARGQRLPHARLSPRLGRRRTPATCPQKPRDHARLSAPRLPEIKPDTLQVYPTRFLCMEPGATRSLFDPDCPLAMCRSTSGRACSCPRPACSSRCSRSAAAPVARLTLGRRPHGARRRAVQPRPLQPGLGAVGIPVLA
jgi:hypothetical protein